MQRFLPQRQIAESVGVQLHDRRFVDPLEQIRRGRVGAEASRSPGMLGAVR